MDEGWICFSVAWNVQFFISKIADARGKAESEQMHEREHMIGEPSGIGSFATAAAR